MKYILWLIVLLIPIYALALRDPTKPPPYMQIGQTMTSQALTLNGIILGKRRKIAVINGINKKIGDEILGQYITGIYLNKVILNGPNGKMTLFVFDKPVARAFESQSCF